jgi:diguanylate cyclase (GGDEF)-like protein/PAS domain S-box-containing protein
LQGRTAVHLDGPAAERQRHARALKSSEIRYRRLFETAPYGILVLEAETGVVIDVNSSLCQLVGYAATEIVDRPLWSVPAFKNAAATKNHFRDLLTESHLRYDDLPLETKDGQIKRVELVATIFLAENRPFVQCTVHDVTDSIRREHEHGTRVAAADQAARLAARRSTHDQTTGLLNRWYLEETLPRELHRAARAKAPLTVSVLELDRTLEGDAGDAVLREVGRILREHLRKSDMACRCDNREFVLVLPQSTPKATVERLEQIRASLKELAIYHGDQLINGITVSAGVAIAGPDGVTTSELVDAAHNAMTAAQRGGGDGIALKQTEEKKT